MSIEKRKSRRLSRGIKVLYQVSNGQSVSSVHYFGTITDSCNGGIGLSANHPVELDDQIQFDGLGGRSEKHSGKVTWIKKYRDTYQIGVKLGLQH